MRGPMWLTFIFIVLLLFAAALRVIGQPRKRTARRATSRRAPTGEEDLVQRLARIPGATVEQRHGRTYVTIGGDGSRSHDADEEDDHLPTILWNALISPPERCRIEYRDRAGHVTERVAHMARRGVGENGREYVGIYDRGQFKTLRTDRILEIEILQAEN